MNQKGFSLMELLTVVLIVGILSAVALPQYNKVVDKANFTKIEVLAKSLHDSCERMISEWGVEDWGEITPEEKRTLSRLDIGDDNLLPKGFKLSGETIIGKDFTFSLLNSCGDDCSCKVHLVQTGGAYSGTVIDYAGQALVCDQTANAEGCEVYGLD